MGGWSAAVRGSAGRFGDGGALPLLERVEPGQRAIRGLQSCRTTGFWVAIWPDLAPESPPTASGADGSAIAAKDAGLEEFAERVPCDGRV